MTLILIISLFTVLFLFSCESCFSRLKTQPAETDKTPRESNILSLFYSHYKPPYSMSHPSSYHSDKQTYISELPFTTYENVAEVF